MPNISIIIPIYKAEKYLDRCINSIINQSYQDFELILVNDGSPDKSLTICRAWAEKDIRIKIIDQENQGAHAARKNGFLCSSAPYITFVDADDYLPIDALITLYTEAHKGYDIVKGQDLVRQSVESFSNSNIELNRQDFLEKTYLSEIEAYLWGTIYKRSLFDKYIFDMCINNKILIGEDFLTNLYIGKKINKALILNKGVYYYCINEDGMMNSAFMSDVYRERMRQMIASILDMNNSRWMYLFQLKQAAGIGELFIPERGFVVSQFSTTKNFINRYGIDILYPYVNRKHLKFINNECVFRLYTWCYRIAKLLLKYRGNTRRKIQ